MNVEVDSIELQIQSTAKSTNNELEKLESTMQRIKGLTKSNFGLKSVATETEKIKSLSSKSIGFPKMFKNLLGSFSVQAVGKTIAKWVSSANEYVENVNLFETSMGQFYDEAKQYADLVESKLGVDSSAWMRNQGVFMSMATGFGLANDKAYQLSESLTELTYDISSLYNEDIDTAAKRLQSALAGEIEPIRRLGISISQATLQEYALSKGINESVSSMTEQEKALLRSFKIIEDSKRIGAVGDFAKTLESPANALRVLKQQIQQFGRAMGTIFIPALIQVMPFAQALVSLATDAAKALATLVGFKMPEWDNNSWNNSMGEASGATDEVTESVKALKNATLGIDELNVIGQDEGTGGAGGYSDWINNFQIPDLWDKEAISEMETKAESIKKIFKNMANGIKETFEMTGIRVMDIFSTIKKQFSAFDWGSALKESGETLLEAWNSLFETILAVAAPVLEGLNIPKLLFSGLETYTKVLETLKTILDSVRIGMYRFSNTALKPIAEWIGDKVVEVFEAIQKQLSKISDWFKEHTEQFTKIGQNIGEITAKIWAFIEPIANVLIDEVFGVIEEWLNTFWEGASAFVDLAALLSDCASAILEVAEAWGVLDVIQNVISERITRIANFIKEPIVAAKNVIVFLTDVFKGDWDKVWSDVLQIVDTFGNQFMTRIKMLFHWEWVQAILKWWDDYVAPYFSLPKWKELLMVIPNAFKNIWNSVVSWWDTSLSSWWNNHVAVWFRFDTWLNLGKNAIDGLMSGLGSLLGIDIGLDKIGAYAAGGYPTSGELFIAREAGPELVGAIGSRTAVANNDQIVSGIQHGVEEGNMGVVAALYQAITVLERIEQKETVVELDGDEIAQKTTRTRNGYSLGLTT